MLLLSMAFLPVALEWDLGPDKVSSKEEAKNKEIRMKAFVFNVGITNADQTCGRASLGGTDCQEERTFADL